MKSKGFKKISEILKEYDPIKKIRDQKSISRKEYLKWQNA